MKAVQMMPKLFFPINLGNQEYSENNCMFTRISEFSALKIHKI